MPESTVNVATLGAEIEASAITTNFFRAWVDGDVLSLLFDTLPLPAGDQTILDNDTTGPAGGLLAAHDNDEVDAPVAHTADATLQAGAPRYNTNEGAAGQVIVTLPNPKAEAPNDPLIFEVVAAQNFRIKAAAGHTIRYGDKLSIAGGYVESAVVGALVMLLPSGNTCWTASIVGHGKVWGLEDT
jgi:hypothetical protein